MRNPSKRSIEAVARAIDSSRLNAEDQNWEEGDFEYMQFRRKQATAALTAFPEVEDNVKAEVWAEGYCDAIDNHDCNGRSSNPANPYLAEDKAIDAGVHKTRSINSRDEMAELREFSVVLDSHEDVLQLRGGLWHGFGADAMTAYEASQYLPASVLYEPAV